MAYDEDLADRIREAVGPERNLSEKKMFGGLAFLVNGNMAVAAAGSSDGLMVRVDPARADELVAAGEADRMVMRDRPLRGWLLVAPERLAADEQLARWVRIGVGYARSLPSK